MFIDKYSKHPQYAYIIVLGLLMTKLILNKEQRGNLMAKILLFIGISFLSILFLATMTSKVIQKEAHISLNKEFLMIC